MPIKIKGWLRILIYMGAGFLAILALIPVVWSLSAGPVTVYRLITRGDTTIYDYQRFPSRSLSASPVPFRFQVSLQDDLVPETIHLDNSEDIQLEEILETSGTIAFLVIKDDVIIYERYFHGHREEGISQVFSVSKSIDRKSVV